MLFRKATVAALREQASLEQQEPSATSEKFKHQRQADMSKIVSQRWRSLTKEERAVWDEMAAEVRRQHTERHPDYQYHPGRRAAIPLPSRCNIPRTTKVSKGERHCKPETLEPPISQVHDSELALTQRSSEIGTAVPQFSYGNSEWTPPFDKPNGHEDAAHPQQAESAMDVSEHVSLPSTLIVIYLSICKEDMSHFHASETSHEALEPWFAPNQEHIPMQTDLMAFEFPPCYSTHPSPTRLSCQLPELIDDFSRFLNLPDDCEPFLQPHPEEMMDIDNYLPPLYSECNQPTMPPLEQPTIGELLGSESVFDLEWNIYFGFPKGDSDWIGILDTERLSFVPLDWF
jgi:hypothetical protein